jgi:hypothetical protein
MSCSAGLSWARSNLLSEATNERAQAKMAPLIRCAARRWMIDVQAVGRDGRLRRVRKIAPMQTRVPAAAKLEHETRAELMLVDDRVVTTAPEAPRFADFAEQFVSTYAVTNNKHAEVVSKRKILRVHLVPALRRAPPRPSRPRRDRGIQGRETHRRTREEDHQQPPDGPAKAALDRCRMADALGAAAHQVAEGACRRLRLLDL